ncbi:hypothetical protein ACFSR7_05960 [Cohnella sp. GCM10020058]|uniref:hypothetical protein n=1 Tax=Cohnella sp. GCM10020058 TaxID=3317330 RepID=UPI003642C084
MESKIVLETSAGIWSIIADLFASGPAVQVFLNGKLVASKSYSELFYAFTAAGAFADDVQQNKDISEICLP